MVAERVVSPKMGTVSAAHYGHLLVAAYVRRKCLSLRCP
jgi:hypothetical protein